VFSENDTESFGFYSEKAKEASFGVMEEKVAFEIKLVQCGSSCA
jgi:hypothetical protein